MRRKRTEDVTVEDAEDMPLADLCRIVRERVSMWDVLDALEVPHPAPNPRGVKIHGFREENDPSLHVYPDHWFDFGTGEGGSVIDFYKKATGEWSTRRAAMALLDLAPTDGWQPVRSETPADPAEIEKVLSGHSLFLESVPLVELPDNPDLALRFERVRTFVEQHWAPFRYWEFPWSLPHLRASRWNLLLCYWTPDGRHLIGVKTRSLINGEKESLTGSRFSLAGLWRLWQGETPEVVVVTEGESDALAMQAVIDSGIKGFWGDRSVGVCSIPSGAGKIRPSWFELLKGCRLVVVAFDDDDPGRKAAGQAVQALENLHVDVVDWVPPAGDLRETIRRGPDATVELIALDVAYEKGSL
ncbi:MAG: toprim domain-containing protein [Bacteroidetes bacterium]|nr:MAG: toprim domain-containing protein [Bacteroidota bacterium]